MESKARFEEKQRDSPRAGTKESAIAGARAPPSLQLAQPVSQAEE